QNESTLRCPRSLIDEVTRPFHDPRIGGGAGDHIGVAGVERVDAVRGRQRLSPLQGVADVAWRVADAVVRRADVEGAVLELPEAADARAAHGGAGDDRLDEQVERLEGDLRADSGDLRAGVLAHTR